MFHDKNAHGMKMRICVLCLNLVKNLGKLVIEIFNIKKMKLMTNSVKQKKLFCNFLLLVKKSIGAQSALQEYLKIF